MAPAKSRRKNNARRQASSDIEEGQASQVDNMDDVVNEDEEEAPVKQEKNKKKEQQVTRAEPPAPAVEEDDDDDIIDVDNFGDHPLGKQDAGKLNGLARDWEAMSRKIQSSWNTPADVATAMTESAEGDEGVKVRVLTDYAVSRRLMHDPGAR